MRLCYRNTNKTRVRSNDCPVISQHTGLVWTTVFSEQEGTGNGAQFDNSDIRTLNLVQPPFDVTKGNYRVRMEWGSEGWAEFTVRLVFGTSCCAFMAPRLTTSLLLYPILPRAYSQVPENSNIFGSQMNPNIVVVDVKTNADQIQMGSTAHFCHACVKNGKKYVVVSMQESDSL